MFTSNDRGAVRVVDDLHHAEETNLHQATLPAALTHAPLDDRQVQLRQSRCD
jgi:hypothetical protein